MHDFNPILEQRHLHEHLHGVRPAHLQRHQRQSRGNARQDQHCRPERADCGRLFWICTGYRPGEAVFGVTGHRDGRKFHYSGRLHGELAGFRAWRLQVRGLFQVRMGHAVGAVGSQHGNGHVFDGGVSVASGFCLVEFWRGLWN